VKIITWNLAQRDRAWRILPDTDADIALVQEATEPPSDIIAVVVFQWDDIAW